MSKLNLSDYTLKDIDELISEAQKARLILVEKRHAELLAELQALGFSPPPQTRVKPPAKFSDKLGQTWSGRGVPPKWIRDHEAKGGSRFDFRVKV